MSSLILVSGCVAMYWPLAGCHVGGACGWGAIIGDSKGVAVESIERLYSRHKTT